MDRKEGIKEGDEFYADRKTAETTDVILASGEWWTFSNEDIYQITETFDVYDNGRIAGYFEDEHEAIKFAARRIRKFPGSRVSIKRAGV